MVARLHCITTTTLLLTLLSIPARAEQNPAVLRRATLNLSWPESGIRDRSYEPLLTQATPNNEATPSETPPPEETAPTPDAPSETPPPEETAPTPDAPSETPPPEETAPMPDAPSETPSPEETAPMPDAPSNEATQETAPSPPEADSENWEEFNSNRGGFTISFPGTPVEQIEPADPTQGTLETGAYLWESDANPMGYGLFYKILPSTPNAEQVAKFFDDFRDDFVANGVVAGKLLEERPINIERYPGREISVEGAEGYVKARVYLVNERLYLLVAVAPSKTDFPAAGDRFLNSFRVY